MLDDKFQKITQRVYWYLNQELDLGVEVSREEWDTLRSDAETALSEATSQTTYGLLAGRDLSK